MENQEIMTIKDRELSLYRKFARYNGEIFFEWDLNTDSFYVTENGHHKIDERLIYGNFANYMFSSSMIHPEDQYILEQYLDKIFNFSGNMKDCIVDNEYYTRVECRVRLSEETTYMWVKFHLLAQYDESMLPVKVIGSFIDIDSQKKQHKLLEMQAQHDALTGLYNKGITEHMMKDFLNGIINIDSKHAFLLIDMDGFKNVNDFFGHYFGDTVINDIANNINKQFRNTDIVGRFGGDEFAILIKNIETEDFLTEKCEKLLKELRRTYTSQDQVFKISVSIGVACFPEHGQTYEDLFRRADFAMYKAKERGKDQYMVYSEDLAAPRYHNYRDDTSKALQFVKDKSFRENIQEYIFNLLYHSVNIKLTLQMLMEVIGKAFEVDRVFIYEYDSVNDRYYHSFEWGDKGVYDSNVFYGNENAESAILALYRETKYGFVAKCANINCLPSSVNKIFQGSGIQAFLHCRIVERGNVKGCIGFDQCRSERNWSEREIELLSSVANILGTFLLKQKSLDNIEKKRAKIHELINFIDAGICVIDKTTMEILFMNQKLRALIKRDGIGMKCYTYLQESANQCAFCPLPTLCVTKDSMVYDFLVKDCDEKFAIKAADIEWYEGQEAYLVMAYKVKSSEG